MIQRRTVLRSGAAALVPFVQLAAQSQTAAEADYEDVSTPFDPNYRLFGTKPATPPEELRAKAILDAAPTTAPPIAIARYFEGITETNSDTPPRYYNAQWADRWNPVIMAFFVATSIDKKYVYQRGDTVDWCAAFINWCLIRAGYEFTNSAMSGSFRKFGAQTTKPKPGDIVVFRKVGDAGDAGHGHVTLLIERTNGTLKVLGGNQKAGKKYSSVNTTALPEKGERLVLHSFRSLESIKKRTA